MYVEYVPVEQQPAPTEPVFDFLSIVGNSAELMRAGGVCYTADVPVMLQHPVAPYCGKAAVDVAIGYASGAGYLAEDCADRFTAQAWTFELTDTLLDELFKRQVN